MAILRRDDGVQFVLQPYRELITLKNKSLLKRELQHLSENHGAYARIFRQNNNYEAVFSRDSGYLLGEAIWQHLGKPDNLLYCEALTEPQKALIVIVREGMVYLDTVLNYANLSEELAFLLAEKNSFAVYVYGDAPISEQPQANRFALETSQIKSFTRLHTPLYTTLRVAPELRLLPIERAVAELNLDQNTYIALTSLAIIIIAALVFGWFASRPAAPVAAVNPLEAYQAALQTPDPAAQLNTLAEQIIQAYNVPGWIPTKVNYENGVAGFELHTIGSSVAGLLQWAAANRLPVTLMENGALLNLSKALPARTAPANQASAQLALALLLDRMQQILPGNNVKIGLIKPDGLYKEINLTVTLNNVSPDLLRMIGNVFNGLPVVLGKGRFDLNNGLLSGTIQLSVLGN